MNVCLISKEFYPVYAGAAERYKRYAKKLDKYGISFKVVTFKYGDLPTFDVIDGIEIKRITPQKFFANFSFVKECFKNFNSQIDVIQFLNFPSIFPPPAFCRLFNIQAPCIYTYTITEDNIKRTLKGKANRTYRRLLYKSFKKIIVLSSFMKSELISMGVPEHRIIIIPNGVDVDRFRPPKSPKEKEELRLKLGFNMNDYIAVYIGALHPRKGVDVLLSSWKYVQRAYPNAMLLFIGPPSNKYLNYYNELIKSAEHLPNPEKVHFLGRVPNVEEYLRIADLFVFPSYREGLPNSILEAMATGLPVVTVPFRGLTREIGRPGKEFILVERTPKTLAEGILRVLRDREFKFFLGTNARDWIIKNKLDLEHTLAKLTVFYKRLKDL